jgi:AcrR family transcriptional regulator
MTRARPYDREEALDAAMTLFWRKGFHATSLKDLENALNMKPGSIYAAFNSKEALYLATLERYFERNRDALRQMAEASPSPLKALADHLRSFAGEDGAKPACRACMLIKTLLTATEEDDAIATQARHYLDAMTEEIRAIFEKAKTLGELPESADPARLAQRYQADMTALRIETHRAPATPALKALAEDMAREVEGMRTWHAA